jgi:chromatin assembly factor 1 subunit B
MVYPNITPQSLVEAASNDAANPPVPRPPRVEYLATLSRHSAPVNVVRFSPNGALACPRYYASFIPIYPPDAQGELIASAGDGARPYSCHGLAI